MGWQRWWRKMIGFLGGWVLKSELGFLPACALHSGGVAHVQPLLLQTIVPGVVKTCIVCQVRLDCGRLKRWVLILSLIPQIHRINLTQFLNAQIGKHRLSSDMVSSIFSRNFSYSTFLNGHRMFSSLFLFLRQIHVNADIDIPVGVNVNNFVRVWPVRQRRRMLRRFIFCDGNSFGLFGWCV